jgi:hypothetical protein
MNAVGGARVVSGWYIANVAERLLSLLGELRDCRR